jgi:hypothetical protein
MSIWVYSPQKKVEKSNIGTKSHKKAITKTLIAKNGEII